MSHALSIRESGSLLNFFFFSDPANHEIEMEKARPPEDAPLFLIGSQPVLYEIFYFPASFTISTACAAQRKRSLTDWYSLLV